VKGGRGEDQRRPTEGKIDDDQKKDTKERHTLNTISGGFAGEGSQARPKRSMSGR